MHGKRFIVPIVWCLLSAPAVAQFKATAVPGKGTRVQPPGIGAWVWHVIWFRDCSGTWTDVSSDVHNCGQCGRQCASTENCCSRKCVDAHDNCGGCGAPFACAQDQTCCPQTGVWDGSPPGDYQCVNLATDARNCSACQQTCDLYPGNGVLNACCEYGRCLTDKDFQSDTRNCGGCYNDCVENFGPDYMCISGHCCPHCTVWFPGADGISAGCYSCDDVNRWTGSSLACCDGYLCTNLKTDPANCESCGTQCSATGAWNKICANGRCTCPRALPDECQGECVNLSTGPQCGTCGNICLPGSCCVYSAAQGYRICETINFDNDFYHCGECGIQCPPNATCCHGKCMFLENDPQNCWYCGKSCAAGQACCSGVCTYLNSDDDNCGACDHSCFVFEGAEGRNNCCNGTCVNKQADVANCGDCGHQCASNEVCGGGACYVIK